MTFVEIARTSDVPRGKMKHFELAGKEILLVNVDGRFYAVSDRCAHASAPLSMGKLDGTTIVCPLHFARFDVTTGECLSAAVEAPLSGMDKLPPEFIQTMIHMGQLIS
ncbi:MAG: non-heme iron oxygenase ferredoxin subunit, partial [Methanomassiliicoccales archaeon]